MNLVKNDVVQKTEYNAKIKNIEDKIPDVTNLATRTTLNAKINEVKAEISSINNFPTTAALTAVENKILDVSNPVKKKQIIPQELMKLKRKLLIIVIINILLLQNFISYQQKVCRKIRRSTFSNKDRF